MRRREFIPALGCLAGAVSDATPAAPQQTTQVASAANATGRPKLGSVSWNFHSLAPGAQPEEAIDVIGSLGFDGIELIANSRRDVDAYWTDATIAHQQAA